MFPVATTVNIFAFFLFGGHTQGVAFMSEFQKMRTMISRMSKQAGMGGQEGDDAEEMVPVLAGGGAAKKKGKFKYQTTEYACHYSFCTQFGRPCSIHWEHVKSFPRSKCRITILSKTPISSTNS